MIQINFKNRKRPPDLENKLMVAGVEGGMGGMGGRVNWGVLDRHTDGFEMDSQQGPVVQHVELSSALSGGLDGREI